MNRLNPMVTNGGLSGAITASRGKRAEAMGSSETQTILRRKASVGLQEHQARAMTAAKALRLTVAKIADEIFDMSMSVIGIVSEKRDLDGCLELLDEQSLLAALDGPNRTRGGVVIGADIVGGLIQQQTMSLVSAPLDDARKMTSTDAAMCAPLVDALFERVPPQLEMKEEQAMMSGFAFGARADEARILSMWLEAPEFHVIRMTLDMAGGVRQGQMVLILPVVEDFDAMSSDAGAQDADGDPEQASSLSDAVLSVPAELRVDVCKLTMPLMDLEALKVGHVLQLPQNGFPEANITTLTGRVIGSGIVGQVEGTRAMRLKQEPIYASQPRRRTADRAGLDLPEIEALPETKQRSGDAPAAPDMSPPMIETLPAPTPDAAPAALELPDLNDLPSAEDPGLTELPDLNDLPDLATLPDVVPEVDALPELDDLPDLASLPDLADLTKTG